MQIIIRLVGGVPLFRRRQHQSTLSVSAQSLFFRGRRLGVESCIHDIAVLTICTSHFGYTEYTEPDAARCYSIANIGLQILSQLDKAKYAAVFPHLRSMCFRWRTLPARIR